MKIRRHASASAFLARAERWLLRSEAANNVPIGVARRYREQQADDASALSDTSPDTLPDSSSDTYWVTLERDGEVAGCAFRTPPYRLALTACPLDAIPRLVDDVAEFYARLPGVGGPLTAAERFADEWARRFGVEWKVHTRLRLHVLTRVTDPERPPPGRLRPAEAEELPLIREWTRDFVRDVAIIEDPDGLAQRLIASGRLYLWDDGGPRCMVAAARDTPSGACINAVFTPQEGRRHGYATAAVAATSRLLLDDGYRFCCLYTDLGNPTANAIYRRIGYEAVQDAVDIDFSGAPGPTGRGRSRRPAGTDFRPRGFGAETGSAPLRYGRSSGP